MTVTRAWLAQRPIRDTSFSQEDVARGYTASLYSLLLPPDVALTAASQVVDEGGAVYEIEGDPAIRRDRFGTRALFVAATLRRLSDRQEG